MIDQTEFTKKFFESWPEHEFDSYDAEEALRHLYMAVSGERFRDPGRKMRELADTNFLERRTSGTSVRFRYNREH